MAGSSSMLVMVEKNKLGALFDVSGVGARAGRAIPNMIAVRPVSDLIGYQRDSLWQKRPGEDLM
jgi:hypothetical protein